MATIIQFPSATNKSLEAAIEVTSARLKKIGLTESQIAEAITELRDAITPLFRSLSMPIEIPNELELTPNQVDGVMEKVQEFFGRVKEEHAKDIAYAVNVIAGLAARSAMERK